MKISITQSDITSIEVDTIVNAANNTLLGGGGIDGAIHRKAGNELFSECLKIRETTHPDGLPTGEAVITKGYNLPSKHIIHVVGPVYGRENGLEAKLLSNCYLNALSLAEKHNLKSLAFPAISTGAFGYPMREATEVVASTLKQVFEFQKESSIESVEFVLRSGESFETYQQIFKQKNLI